MGELAGLVEDVRGDGDLADVVKLRGDEEVLDRIVIESEGLGERLGQSGNAVLMSRGVWVPCLDHERHDRGDRLEASTRVLELCGPLGNQPLQVSAIAFQLSFLPDAFRGIQEQCRHAVLAYREGMDIVGS